MPPRHARVDDVMVVRVLMVSDDVGNDARDAPFGAVVD